jgi:hypothetical protein
MIGIAMENVAGTAVGGGHGGPFTSGKVQADRSSTSRGCVGKRDLTGWDHLENILCRDSGFRYTHASETMNGW